MADGGISLRTCYAMSGTDLVYRTTRLRLSKSLVRLNLAQNRIGDEGVRWNYDATLCQYRTWRDARVA
eukprot:2697813-Rhodomonas_salina.2